MSPELQVDSLPAKLPGKLLKIHIVVKILEIIFSMLICINIVFSYIKIKGHILFSLWMVVFTFWQIFFFFNMEEHPCVVPWGTHKPGPSYGNSLTLGTQLALARINL